MVFVTTQLVVKQKNLLSIAGFAVHPLRQRTYKYKRLDLSFAIFILKQRHVNSGRLVRARF